MKRRGRGGAGNHALAGFPGNEKNGVLRRGTDVLADPATGAKLRTHAGFSLFDDDGSVSRASLGTHRTERSLPSEQNRSRISASGGPSLTDGSTGCSPSGGTMVSDLRPSMERNRSRRLMALIAWVLAGTPRAAEAR